MIARSVPLTSFAAVMGFAGLGLAYSIGGPLVGVTGSFGNVFLIAAGLLFVVLLVLWWRYTASAPDEFRQELASPPRASYLGSLTISCSLLALGVLPYQHQLAEVLWALSAVGGAAVVLYLLGRWIEQGIHPSLLTPSLLIPVVGNATSCYAGTALHHNTFALASFAFAALCGLTLGPIILFRLLAVEPKLPSTMAPSLGVLVSTPAVLASAWSSIGHVDIVAQILAFKALFFAMLCARLWRLAWGEPFSVAMWGLSLSQFSGHRFKLHSAASIQIVPD